MELLTCPGSTRPGVTDGCSCRALFEFDICGCCSQTLHESRSSWGGGVLMLHPSLPHQLSHYSPLSCNCDLHSSRWCFRVLLGVLDTIMLLHQTRPANVDLKMTACSLKRDGDGALPMWGWTRGSPVSCLPASSARVASVSYVLCILYTFVPRRSGENQVVLPTLTALPTGLGPKGAHSSLT